MLTTCWANTTNEMIDEVKPKEIKAFSRWACTQPGRTEEVGPSIPTITIQGDEAGSSQTAINQEHASEADVNYEEVLQGSDDEAEEAAELLQNVQISSGRIPELEDADLEPTLVEDFDLFLRTVFL